MEPDRYKTEKYTIATRKEKNVIIMLNRALDSGVFSLKRVASVILAGKRTSRRHFTAKFFENSVVAKRGIDALLILSFCNQERV